MPEILITKNTHVAELLAVLNRDSPEWYGLNILLGQIAGIQKQLDTAVHELAEVRRSLAGAQQRNHPAKMALQKAEEAMRQYVSGLREKLQRLKEAVAAGCKNAFAAFREKGNAALAHLSRFFKVQPILETIRSDAEKAAKTAEQAISAVEAAGARYHEAGRNLRNAGRALSGKSGITETKPNGKAVRGMAAPFRAARSCFKGIGKHTEAALKRLKQLEEKAAKPPRIKKILRECGKQAERENRSKRGHKDKNIVPER